MGLDMYAFTVSAADAGDNVVDLDLQRGTPNEIETTELFYWRKFNALHGWMQRLYYEKGGKSPDFNCNTVRVTHNDLDMLEYDVAKGKLTPTEGFFFGSQEIYPEDLQSVARFIEKARQAIRVEGKAVYYDSWW